MYGEKGFRLRTNAKTVTLSADSIPSREEWVKAIRKVIFKAQNMGDSVKVIDLIVFNFPFSNSKDKILQIAIPYSAIIDVERSNAMDFSETIEVKVEDKDSSLPIDSYFFAYFRDLPDALEQIRDAVRNYRSQNTLPTQSTPPLLDTTALRSPNFVPARATADYPKGTSFRFSSLFRPFSDTNLLSRGTTAAADSNSDDYTYIQRKENSSFIPITLSPKHPTSFSLFRQGTDSTSSSRQTTHSLPIPDHTYPPSTSNSTIYPDASSLNRDSTSYWGLGVPAWIKSPRRHFGGGLDSHITCNGSHVKEVYSTAASPGPMTTSRSSGAADLSFSILETPDQMVDHETIEKFHSAFAYDEKETLLGCMFLN